MQTVANLDKDDANVVAHGKQQLLEVLCLGRGLFSEDTAADLGQSVHNLRYLRAKDVLDVLCGVVGVFHHVVQQGSTDTGRAQSHLLTGYLGNSDGVHDIGLARQTAHAFVCLSGKVECLGDEIHLLAVT